jgi:CDP-diacylglycerol--glycerol-3-phosphate 3-phosphatidyltransferase
MKLNLANRVTLVRVLLVPVFMVVLLIKDIPQNNYIAAGIFIIAAITDSIDGYIARSRNQVTNFGKFMDPIADKLLVVAALLCLVESGAIASWMAMIIISREYIVTGMRLVAAAEGIVIAASKLGKIKTITQIVAIVAILIKNYPFSIFISTPVDKILLWVAVIFTVVSGIEYIVKNRGVLFNMSNS